jgi:sporadic carbohydrate cluster protein (TIGR04323 family)
MVSRLCIKGYITARNNMIRESQAAQNSSVRQFIEDQGYEFSLSSVEWLPDKGDPILISLLNALTDYDGFCLYSYLSPTLNRGYLEELFGKVIAERKLLIFARERLIVRSTQDLKNLFRVKAIELITREYWI